MAEPAFSGLRVLDLSTGSAAAHCTKWFAGFGADVILVEPPGGSPARRVGPFAGDGTGPDDSLSFRYLNGGKQSVTIDLEQEAGRDLIRRLLPTVALLVEDSPPGTMSALGLAWEEVRAQNPGLVYLSLTPFGQNGPYRDLPATDLTLAAFSGTMNDRLLAGRNPVRMGGSQGDAIGGRVAFISAMSALLARDATGEGQHVDLSMHEAIASVDMAAPTTYSYTGVVHQPRRTTSTRGRGGMGRYPVKDGWVDIMPGVGGLPKLARLLGDPELANHELFTDHALRARKADEFDKQFMDPWVSQRTAREVVEQGQALGMPFSYTMSLRELLADPQLAARGFLVTTGEAEGTSGTQPGAPVRLSAAPWESGTPPSAGEHDAAILGQELGVTPSDIARLHELGVV
ncbi:MAG: CoA transferase [Dehalococcoidia bacterium]|nr:CoA transferase [Dehalococcoidia bacterium]